MPGSQYLLCPNCTPQFSWQQRPSLTSPVDATFREFLRASCSLWLEESFRRVRAQPTGLRSDPTFSLANSPVSPVDRQRLLTAPYNVGGRTPNHNVARLVLSPFRGVASAEQPPRCDQCTAPHRVRLRAPKRELRASHFV